MKKKTFRSLLVILVIIVSLQFLSAQLLSAAPTGQRLRVLANPSGFLIGTAIRSDFRTLDTGMYAQVSSEEFNFVTCESAMQMDITEPTQNSFNFTQADEIVRWARSNGMKIHGRFLAGQNPPPTWVGGIADKTVLTNAMYNHIDKVMAHFKGQILVWDVVAEALNPDGSYRRTIWFNVMGNTFIELAFARARQADPDARLIYNDYDIEERGPKSDAVYSFIRSMRERGMPIDGIGFEMHLTDSGLDYESFAGNMARFAALGLEIYITEMDVRLPDGNRDLQKQADIYSEVLKRCLAQPACKAVQVWGVVDKYSWCMSVFPGTGAPLLFDDRYNPKPAYYSVQAVLATLPTSSPTATPAPTPTPAVINGDVNGDNTVTIVDALLLAQRSSGLNPAVFIERNADVNCDGAISILDALLTARFSAGLLSSLPCN